MRGTFESMFPFEIVLYKARRRSGNLTAGYVRVGTAKARTEDTVQVITNQDGMDIMQNMIKVFFFNDLGINAGDYLSLPRDEEVREIITYKEQVFDDDGDLYCEVRVQA